MLSGPSCRDLCTGPYEVTAVDPVKPSALRSDRCRSGETFGRLNTGAREERVVDADHHLALAIVRNTASKSPGDELITPSTSDVAVCCCSASRSSRLRRATSPSLLVRDESELTV